jgi:hypothetical protein
MKQASNNSSTNSTRRLLFKPGQFGNSLARPNNVETPEMRRSY